MTGFLSRSQVKLRIFLIKLLMRRTYKKKSRFTESQIIGILKEAESRRAKYGGMDVSMMKRMKELEEENRRLKKMYAEERALKGRDYSGGHGKKW